MLRSSLLLAIASLAFPSIALADGPSDTEQAKSLLKGCWTSIEKIRTGVVRVGEIDAVGVTEVDPNADDNERFEYFLAFDNQAGLLRFDNENKERTTRYARNSRESLLWLSDRSVVNVFPRDYKVLVEDAKPLDFRPVAVTLFAAYRNKWPIDRIRDYCDKLVNSPLTKKLFHNLVSSCAIRFAQRIAAANS